jgi:hypothetical protein
VVVLCADCNVRDVLLVLDSFLVAMDGVLIRRGSRLFKIRRASRAFVMRMRESLLRIKTRQG